MSLALGIDSFLTPVPVARAQLPMHSAASIFRLCPLVHSVTRAALWCHAQTRVLLAETSQLSRRPRAHAPQHTPGQFPRSPSPQTQTCSQRQIGPHLEVEQGDAAGRMARRTD